MTTTTDAVRKAVEVRVPVPMAWTVFTEEMHRWWPLASHSLSAERGVTPDGVVVEGWVGGAIYETIGDDRRDWGTVAEWDPPVRFSVDWAVRPGVVTRWTATFTATSTGTRLEVVHVGFEAYGAEAEAARANYGSDDGWSRVLGAFAAVTDGT